MTNPHRKVGVFCLMVIKNGTDGWDFVWKFVLHWWEKSRQNSEMVVINYNVLYNNKYKHSRQISRHRTDGEKCG